MKGVNFFGPKSEFVISGSDCGYIFIWDKNTEAIVNWMPGDEQGVVCSWINLIQKTCNLNIIQIIKTFCCVGKLFGTSSTYSYPCNKWT